MPALGRAPAKPGVFMLVPGSWRIIFKCFLHMSVLLFLSNTALIDFIVITDRDGGGGDCG